MESVKKQLEEQGKIDQYYIFEELINDKYYSKELRDAGIYHPAGGSTRYRRTMSVGIEYHRTFVPYNKIPNFLKDMNTYSKGEGLVGLMTTLYGGVFGGLLNMMTFGANSQIYKDISDTYILNRIGVEIIFTMDDYQQGAQVVLNWNGDYLLYHSDAENLRVNYL